MGDPRRQHKQYKRPRTPFDKTRIDEEKTLLKKFGLKNKKEIWRSERYIDKIRAQAKKLILNPEQQHIFINRLVKLGLAQPKATIDDILALTKEKLFERRFQTIVFKRGLAKSLRAARQLIAHKNVKIKGRVVNIPGYIVRTEEENKISLVRKEKKEKLEKLEKIEKKEVPEEESKEKEKEEKEKEK